MAFRQLHMLQLYFISKVLPNAEQIVIQVILINIKNNPKLNSSPLLKRWHLLSFIIE